MTPFALIAKAERAFNRAQDIRQVADYTGHLIDPADVVRVIHQAADFVRVMKEKVSSRSNLKSGDFGKMV